MLVLNKKNTPPANVQPTQKPKISILNSLAASVGLKETPNTVKTAEPVVKAVEPLVKTVEPEVKMAEPEVKMAEPEVKMAEPEIKTAEPVVDPTTETVVESGLPKTFMPLDNCGLYTDTWKIASTHLRAFEALDTFDVKIIDSLASAERYSLVKSDNTVLKDDLDILQATSLILLLRYKAVVKKISGKTFTMPSDFFNEVESNREYHARQLYLLSKSTKQQLEPILKPYLTSFKPSDLEQLDLILFKKNIDENQYDAIWIINHIMIYLAKWEIETFDTLFKEDCIKAIVSQDISRLPSSLRVLSRLVDGKKEKVLEMYPFSVLMNYSHFYPVHLYHTGNVPVE
jgi:hypothetical protein